MGTATTKGRGQASRASHEVPEAGPARATAESAETTIADKLAAPAGVQRQPSGASAMLGEAVWLMSHSAAHKHLFIADLEWLVLPPIMVKQFRILKAGDRPFAFASWALLNEEAEKRLLAGQPRLRPGDWRSGDRLWLIDVVAPFGGADGVLSHLKKKLFKDRRLMALRPKADGRGVVAGEVGDGG